MTQHFCNLSLWNLFWSHKGLIVRLWSLAWHLEYHSPSLQLCTSCEWHVHLQSRWTICSFPHWNIVVKLYIRFYVQYTKHIYCGIKGREGDSPFPPWPVGREGELTPPGHIKRDQSYAFGPLAWPDTWPAICSFSLTVNELLNSSLFIVWIPTNSRLPIPIWHKRSNIWV